MSSSGSLTCISIPRTTSAARLATICAALVKVEGATLQITSGCLIAAAPATPTDAVAGTCVVKVWAHQDVELLWGLGSATRQITAKSVAMYDRTQLCG